MPGGSINHPNKEQQVAARVTHYTLPSASTAWPSSLSSSAVQGPFLRSPLSTLNHLFRQSLFVLPGSAAAIFCQSTALSGGLPDKDVRVSWWISDSMFILTGLLFPESLKQDHVFILSPFVDTPCSFHSNGSENEAQLVKIP